MTVTLVAPEPEPVAVQPPPPAPPQPVTPPEPQPEPEPVPPPEPEPQPVAEPPAPVQIPKPKPKPKPKPAHKETVKPQPRKITPPAPPAPETPPSDAPQRPVAAPAAATASTARDTGPVVLSRPEPAYPDRARALGIEGRVQIQFDVTTEGQVTNLRIISATPRNVFERDIREVTRRWRYQSGKPGQNVNMTIVFKLTGVTSEHQ